MAPAATDSSPQRTFARTNSQRKHWIGWAPLLLLPAAVFAMRTLLLPWGSMWMLSAAIFAGCKWQTWWQARDARLRAQNWKRSIAYLLLWPGMDAQAFFATAQTKPAISAKEWLSAIAKMLA